MVSEAMVTITKMLETLPVQLEDQVIEHLREYIRELRDEAVWIDDPFHPSLRFKCINRSENIWAVRVSLGYRAIGVLDEDTVTWFWVGGYAKYEQFFG